MDSKTIKEYDQKAEEIAAFHSTFAPELLYQLAHQYFHKECPTADIGCGHGRDTQWLSENGFPAIGYEGSKGMLEEAKKRFPKLRFEESLLPLVSNIDSNSFENVFCCAVLMHIPRLQLSVAVSNLLRITKPSGIIVLSFRNSVAIEGREGEKLYESYSLNEIKEAFLAADAVSLFTSEDQDTQRTELKWSTLVLRKNA